MCRQSGKGFSQKFKSSIFLTLSPEKIRLNNYQSMGFIITNRICLYVNGMIDRSSINVIRFNVTNLSYFLGNKRNNPIFFTHPRLFGIKIS